jgi:UTP:GlnB (protein PII) uridylyltransferase
LGRATSSTDYQRVANDATQKDLIKVLMMQVEMLVKTKSQDFGQTKSTTSKLRHHSCHRSTNHHSTPSTKTHTSGQRQLLLVAWLSRHEEPLQV